MLGLGLWDRAKPSLGVEAWVAQVKHSGPDQTLWPNSTYPTLPRQEVGQRPFA